METAVSYARVSSLEQREKGLSIEAQIRFIRKYANDHGFRIIREFVEVETAKDTGRPRFKEMVEFLENSSNCRLILVEKTDRLYRNLRDMILLDDLGVDIHFTKEGAIVGPKARSSDKFMHGIRVLMAKNYVDNLSEEVKKGMMEKVLRGQWPARAPWGYLRSETSGKIVPDPEKSIAIVWLFTRFTEGDLNVQKLHEEFLRQDFGIELSHSHIYRTLANPFYKGIMPWKGGLYVGTHEPIVDPTTWDIVQIILSATQYPPHVKKTNVFAYRRLIKCGHCGSSIVGEFHKRRYVYYRCAGKNGKCKENGYIRAEVVDGMFLEKIKAITPDEATYQTRLLELKQLQDDEKQWLSDEEVRLKAEIKVLQTELEKLLRRNRLDLQSADVSKVRQENILAELSLATETLRMLQIPKPSRYTETEKSLDLMHRADKLFVNGTIEIRRKVVEMLFEWIMMKRGGIQVTPKIQPVSADYRQERVCGPLHGI